MKTVLNGFINSIIAKIENGYDDVATLTPDVDSIPFGMRNWIQISGPLFYDRPPQDDITVTISLDGCNSDKLPIYQKYGYHRYDNDEGITKCYHWNERDNIANEVEDIVITLVGAAKANTFASDEMFTKICENKIQSAKTEASRQKKRVILYTLCFIVLTLIATLCALWAEGAL